MTSLIRMTQLIACGEDVNVINTVCNIKINVVSHSLSIEDDTTGEQAKVSLVNMLSKETKVKPIPNLP